jgi:hypothetical protein
LNDGYAHKEDGDVTYWEFGLSKEEEDFGDPLE